MDFSLTFDQQMMVEATKKMVETKILPVLKSSPKNQSLTKEAALKIFAAAAELGFTSARIPADGGGAGLSMLDYGLMTEQMPPSVGLMLQPHEATTTRIYMGGTDEQREKYMDDLIAGRKIAATGSSEPDVGSNPREVKTTVKQAGDKLVVNGTKLWISNATTFDVINVTGKMERADGSSSMVRVLVDREGSNVATRDIEMLGLHQSPHGEVVFSDCRIPLANLSPDNGETAKLLTVTWLGNRPLVGLMAVNLAQKALDIAIEYSKVRKQFGRPIGSYQLIQQDLSEVHTLVLTSRLLCYNALASIDRGERANGLSAMAKRYAVDACDRAIALAMRVNGAMGLSAELGLEELARDVRMISIPDGTPGILTLIHGRELTGFDAFKG
jgi:alkylation response protein AidB-like acyl-CoA dehydrogenase